MELLSNLGHGLAVALTLQNVAFCLTGALLGTLIGVLPSIGVVATIAMLLPFTFTLEPISALIMLSGIYYGAQYGGSTTAILVNMPGESSSIVTCLDGYQMARQGRAGPALAIAAIGSFIAGCVATVLVAAFSGPLASVAQNFGAPEYFSLMVFGLVAAIVLAQGSVMKAIAMLFAGLLLGLVGTDVNTSQLRFTLDIPELSDGIGFVPIALGLFGLAEVVHNLAKHEDRSVLNQPIRGLMPTWPDFRQALPAMLRRSVLNGSSALLLASALPAAAQEKYPTKPVTIIVASAAGGGTDIMARLLAEKMRGDLGQTIVAENKPGAGGNIGADFVSRAPKDGYTLLMTAGALAIAPSLYAKLSFDPLKDLTGVAWLAIAPLIVVTKPDNKLNSMKDLLDLARREDKKVTFGSFGGGTPSHLGGESINHLAKVSMTHVPYARGGAMLDVLSGDINIAILDALSTIPYITSGKLRALAVTGASALRGLTRCSHPVGGWCAIRDCWLAWHVCAFRNAKGGHRPNECGGSRKPLLFPMCASALSLGDHSQSSQPIAPSNGMCASARMWPVGPR